LGGSVFVFPYLFTYSCRTVVYSPVLQYIIQSHADATLGKDKIFSETSDAKSYYWTKSSKPEPPFRWWIFY